MGTNVLAAAARLGQFAGTADAGEASAPGPVLMGQVPR